MGVRNIVIVVVLLSLPALTFAASIAGSRAAKDRAMADLEERSRREIKLARHALRLARVAYRTGDTRSFIANVLEIERRLDQSYECLAETGVNPRSTPEYFKLAEIEIRHIYRRLEFFQTETSSGDSALVETVRTRVQQIQHELLEGIVSGRMTSVYPGL